MSIDRRTAAKIARKHGLSLQDAQALAVLADNEDDANELAAEFGEDAQDYQAIADRVDGRNW